jgi:hypothetical protein
MKPGICLVFLVTFFAASSWAQSTPKPVYVESYRKGPTRISEQSMVANLSTQAPTFTATIRDSAGESRYQFSIEPHRVGEGDDKIVSWRVLLVDGRRRYMGNVLVATKPPDLLTDSSQDRAWWLDPNPYAVVPLLAQRVFKVEGFYCVVQVKEYRPLVTGGLWLDSMRVEVQFTETDPRGN